MSLQKNISHPNCNPCITSALDSFGSNTATSRTARAGKTCTAQRWVVFARIQPLAFDCGFIALATKLDTKLVTMDKKLLCAFPKRAGVLSTR